MVSCGGHRDVMNLENQNEHRINELKGKIRAIYRRLRAGREPYGPSNLADQVPSIEAEIRRLGGNPYVPRTPFI